MTEESPIRRRSLQFGLRRLLLWTVVIALAFGALSTLGPDTIGWIVFSWWLCALLVLRWVVGSRPTLISSIVIGGLLGGVPVPLPEQKVIWGVIGGLIGVALCVYVEVSCQFVNWVTGLGLPDE